MKNLIQKLFNIFAILILTGLVSALYSCCKHNEPNEPIPNWIDPVFAQELQSRGYIDNVYTVTKEEVGKLTEVDVSGEHESRRGPITSLKGLEFFTSLTSFNCTANHIKNIDVSNLSKLKTLYVSENDLIQLNISNLTELTNLNCYTNFIEKIDFSKNTKLVRLDCSNNKYTSINVSMLTNLKFLTCRYLKLTELDINNCPLLYDLRINGNKLHQIDISSCPYIKVIEIGDNPGLNGVFTIISTLTQINNPPAIFFPEWIYNGVSVHVEYVEP